MYNKNGSICVIAGRPGAGKTIWATEETLSYLRDKNNIVVYIGYRTERERLVRLVNERFGDSEHGQLIHAGYDHAGQAIGQAIDIANADAPLPEGMSHDQPEDSSSSRLVFVIYDQCRFDIFPGRRDLLEAAAKAGVRVCVLCQVFSQVDKNDIDWLTQNCTSYIISKTRPPRLATRNEIEFVYR